MFAGRNTWIVTGVVVPIVAAIIAAVPVWVSVIRPRLDGNDKPTAGPTQVVAPTIEPTNGPDMDDLIPQALLRDADLPDGWVVAEERVVEEPCGLRTARAALDGVSIAFRTEPEGAAYLYHDVGLFAGGDAELLLDAVIDTIATCASSVATSPDGIRVESTVTPLVFPQFGDQSYAFEEIVPGMLTQYTTDSVYIRRGDFLSILIITNAGVPGPEFDAFVEAMAGIAERGLDFVTSQ
jgi:hypothetical protein